MDARAVLFVKSLESIQSQSFSYSDIVVGGVGVTYFL